MGNDPICGNFRMHWLIIILTSLLLLAFLVWASADVGSQVWLKTFCRLNTERKMIALTFDDGPDVMTEKVLDVLERHNARATFFLIGSKISGREHVVQRMIDEGHTVGNHSWSHSGAFPLYDASEMTDELMRTSKAIERITGLKPLLFRPPFGVTDPVVGRVVRRLGLKAVGWNIRSLDTLDGTPRKKVAEKVIRKILPGGIILLHDRCDDADGLLEMLLNHLDSEGYACVTIDEMFQIDAYE